MESRRSCFTLTFIKGIGRRFANIVCKKADVDMNKRVGELFAAELDNLMTIVANPCQFKIQGCLIMVVASLVPNFLMGIITGAEIMVMRYTQMLDKFPLLFPIMYILLGVSSIKWLCMQSILTMTSGFFLLLPDLPKPFGIPIDHSKWWDLAAIPMWSLTLPGPSCAWTKICGL
ncbi:ABC transporter G family member 12 [Pyrus ussuriensis x Pyrus communis]|uniref:ABC transporter G family member 12 n=1 Tax=Pyrus ussuriensis x Pyrus communis TaxID=2448454 RepID=A0A5N5FU97_9ROSA|nr:ABC transporter G family member 12 [Pyrus ussuriensis x Pyrus communis]